MADDTTKREGQRRAIREHIDKYRRYPRLQDKQTALKTVQNAQRQIADLKRRNPRLGDSRLATVTSPTRRGSRKQSDQQLEANMGEKAVEFDTPLSVKDCGNRFQDGIQNGRGLSSRLGGLTAKVMGGESLTWYTPQDDSPFAALNDDPAAFSVGVAVPKYAGAHQHGTNVHMYVWDRGNQRHVVLAAHHSLAGAAHANQLIQAVGGNPNRTT